MYDSDSSQSDAPMLYRGCHLCDAEANEERATSMMRSGFKKGRWPRTTVSPMRGKGKVTSPRKKPVKGKRGGNKRKASKARLSPKKKAGAKRR